MKEWARGSGRTYRELENMFNAIVQNYSNPLYKRLYHFSPTGYIRTHCEHMFQEKFLSTLNPVIKVYKKPNYFKFPNGVIVNFLLTPVILNNRTVFNIQELRGMDNYLVFEDHTIAELERSYRPRDAKDAFAYIEGIQDRGVKQFEPLFMGTWAMEDEGL